MKLFWNLLLILVLSYPTVCFGAAADMAVTVAGAGDGSGTAGDGVTLEWDNAMSLAQWEADIEGSSEAGDTYYVAGGTYTLTGDFQCDRDFNATSPVSIIGVNSGTTAEPPTYSDWAAGSGRPAIVGAANRFIFDNYYVHKNISLTTTNTFGYRSDDHAIMVNCKSVQSSGGNNPAIDINVEDNQVAINCEATSASGTAILATSTASMVIGCYVYDSLVGIAAQAAYSAIVNNIVDTCTTGILLSAGSSSLIANNVIYAGTTGIDGGTSSVTVVHNNIFDAVTTGASWGTEQYTNQFDYNVWDAVTTDVLNVTKGGNSVDGDPGLTNPSAGTPDFTVGSGSNALDAGLQFTDIVTEGNIAGDYKVNIGVDQDDNTAAGGGGGVGGHISIY